MNAIVEAARGEARAPGDAVWLQTPHPLGADGRPKRPADGRPKRPFLFPLRVDNDKMILAKRRRRGANRFVPTPKPPGASLVSAREALTRKDVLRLRLDAADALQSLLPRPDYGCLLAGVKEEPGAEPGAEPDRWLLTAPLTRAPVVRLGQRFYARCELTVAYPIVVPKNFENNKWPTCTYRAL